MAFGSRKSKPITITVESFGEKTEVQLRPLSALEQDQIERALPQPTAPRVEVDGKPVANYADPVYVEARTEWAVRMQLIRLCRMLGAEQFGTDEIDKQVTLLQAEFTVHELSQLILAARQIAKGNDPAAHAAAAKERLTPFAKSSTPPTAPEA